MKVETAVNALSALAHDGRLAIFRLLVKAGPNGMAAGEIARELGIAPSTMSAQLLVLSNAGLVYAQREGRFLIYTADYVQMTFLLKYLAEDCCNGRPEICAPLGSTIARCCPPPIRRT